MVGAAIQVAFAFVPIALIGAIIVGIPAAIVVIPAAFLWTFLMRILGSRRG